MPPSLSRYAYSNIISQSSLSSFLIKESFRFSVSLLQAYQFLADNFSSSAPPGDLYKEMLEVLTPSAHVAATAAAAGKIELETVVSKAASAHRSISAVLFGKDEASSVNSATVVHNGRALIVPLQSSDDKTSGVSGDGSATGLYKEGTHHLMRLLKTCTFFVIS